MSNITPILLIEILGDLKKPDSTDSLSREKVAELSNKLLLVGSAVNSYYFTALIASLVGNNIPMTGQIALAGGKEVQSEGNRRGIIFDESPEEQAIKRWRIGQFTEAETILSERWRESTRQFDLALVKTRYKVLSERLPQTNNLGELLIAIDQYLMRPELQNQLLKLLLQEFLVEPKVASRIFYRWELGTSTQIKEFAPYAFYCFRVVLAFYLGLVRGYIGTRPTNRIDLEYVFYLPFCMVFSSRDRFHIEVVPSFLREDQEFIAGDELKNDLKAMSDYCGSLTESERAKWLDENRRYPPEGKNSITIKLWERYCRSREEILKDSSSSFSSEKALHETIKIMNNYEKSRKTSESSADDVPDESKIDFIIRRHYISEDEPCPCGSGKKLKDCLPEHEKRQRSS